MSRSPTDSEFAEFVTETWSSMYHTAYLLLGDPGLAEDLVQTALAKTYLAWPRLRESQAAPAYAHRTLVNTASSWFRRRSWRRDIPTDRLPETVHEPPLEDRPAMREALQQLTPRQRAVVVLRYYRDLSVEDTATELGCSVGTVKSQTSDALKKMRALLGDATPLTVGGAS
ncbi:MAG: SigE family RNA polymerase sigma factor [Nocardioides sp.]